MNHSSKNHSAIALDDSMTQVILRPGLETFGGEGHFTPVYVFHSQLTFKSESLAKRGRFIKVCRTLAVTQCKIIRLSTERKRERERGRWRESKLNSPDTLKHSFTSKERYVYIYILVFHEPFRRMHSSNQLRNSLQVGERHYVRSVPLFM